VAVLARHARAGWVNAQTRPPAVADIRPLPPTLPTTPRAGHRAAGRRHARHHPKEARMNTPIDIAASKGLIHVIDWVLLPAS
jgi:hypothetical protein